MSSDPVLQRPAVTLAGAPWAAAATLLVGSLGVALAQVLGDVAQLRGVALGTGLVCGFFLLGALNTGLAAAYAPGASLVVALLTYTVQLVGLGLVLVWLGRRDGGADSVDARWLAGAVIVGTLVWTTTLVVRALLQPGVRP